MSRFEKRLTRKRDGKDIGLLTVIRTRVNKLHDERGQRLVNPVRVDSLIITVTSPTGEQVVFHHMPFDQLTLDD
jgi:hypothetical protein